MRLALIGPGAIGRTHAELIRSLAGRAELAVVVGRDLDRTAAFAREFGAEASNSLADVCARPDIDAVAVCVPSSWHADTAITALEAGKHVILEKPIDISLPAADRIIAAERRAERIVAVVSQRRFQPSSAFVHAAVVEGRLGRITSGIVESPFWRSQAYYDSGDWRGTRAIDGGGALMNQGVHAVDLLLWMMGEPQEVMAYAARLAHSDIEVEDTVCATVRFASGALGVITATTAAYPGRPLRLSIHGDEGSAVIDQEQVVLFDVADSADRPPSDSTGTPPPGAAPVPDAAHAVGAAHRAQYLDFVDAVEQGRPPLVTTADGRRALELVLGVYESARTGRPVPLGRTRTG